MLAEADRAAGELFTGKVVRNLFMALLFKVSLLGNATF